MFLIEKWGKYIGILLFPLVLPLPLPMKYSAIALNLLVINLLIISANSSLKGIKTLIKDPVIILFTLYFLTDALNTLLTLDFDKPLIREVKLAYVVLPILILINRETIIKLFELLFKVFVIGVLAYILIAWLYVAYYYIIEHPTYIFDFSDHFVVYVLANEFPYAIHHTYIGIYILVATIYIFSKTIKMNRKKRLIGFAICIFFLFNSFYIGGKSTTLLTGIFIAVLIIKSFLSEIKIKGLHYYVTAFIFISIVGLYGIFEWLSISVKQSFGKRMEIYQRCLDVIGDIFPFGIGKHNLKELPLNPLEPMGKNLIPHNIYFNELIINGLLGLLLLLLMLFYLLYKGYKQNIVFFLFIISIIVIGFTEDLVTRQRGVFFFVFFSAIFYARYKQRSFSK